MTLWIVPLALALCSVASLAAGVWLVLNLPAVAQMFGKYSDIVPPPGKRRVPPGKVLWMLIIFNAGWLAAVAIWIWVLSGEANQAMASSP